MKKIIFILISIFITIDTYAEPFSFSNFYIGGFGGINFINEFEEKVEIKSDDFIDLAGEFAYANNISNQKLIKQIQIDLEPGYATGATLGYRLAKFFRLEGEGAYRNNSFNLLIDKEFPGSGTVQTVTGMANGIFETSFLNNKLIPYCGGGIGEKWENANVHYYCEESDQTAAFHKVISKDWGFAYQGILGFTLLISQKIYAGMEYRYLDGFGMHSNHTLGLSLKRFF